MSRALPPVGWQSTAEHEPQSTTVWECEKTVVMLKQPYSRAKTRRSQSMILFADRGYGVIDPRACAQWAKVAPTL